MCGGSVGSVFNSVSSAVSNTIDDVANAVGGAANAVVTGIGQVGSAVVSGVTNAANTVASATENVVNGVFQTVDNAVSDLGKLTANTVQAVEQDVGAALSSVSSAVNSTVAAAESDFNGVVAAGAADLKQIGDGAGTFFKEYGHALIDVAADYVAPGSSILIDALWTEAENGFKPPSLALLGQAAAQGLADEVLPGIDEALGEALPGIAADVASGTLDQTVETFIKTGQLPTGQSLLTGAASQLIDGLQPDIQQALSDALPDLSDGLQTLENISSTAKELVTTGADLAKLTQGQIVALADTGLTEISTLGQSLSLDPSQILAVEAAGVDIVAPVVKLADSANDIIAYSTAQLDELANVGVTELLATDSAALVIGTSEIDALTSAGLKAVSQYGVILDGTAQFLQSETQASLDEAAQAGVTSLVISGAVNLTASLATEIELAGLSLASTVSQTTLADTGADLAALSVDDIAGLAKAITGASIDVTSSLTLSDAQALAFLKDNLSFSVASGATLKIKDTAETIDALSLQEIAGLKKLGTSQIVVTSDELDLSVQQISALRSDKIRITNSSGVPAAIVDSANNIINLSDAQIASYANFGASTLDVIDSVPDLLGLSEDQLAHLADIGAQITSISDSASAIAALTPDQIGTLLTDGVTDIVATDDIAGVVANAAKIADIGLSVSKWNISDVAATIDALTAIQLKQMGNLGVTTIRATDASVDLTVSQALNAASDGIAIATAPNQSVNVDASAVAIESLSSSAIAALGAAGVTRLKSTDASVVLSQDQADALVAAGIKVGVPTNDSATVVLPRIAYTLPLVTNTISSPLFHGPQIRPVADLSNQPSSQQLLDYDNAGLSRNTHDYLTVSGFPSLITADSPTSVTVSGSVATGETVQYGIYDVGSDVTSPTLAMSGSITPSASGTWSAAIDLSGLSDGDYTVVTSEIGPKGPVDDVKTSSLVVSRSTPTVTLGQTVNYKSSTDILLHGSVGSDSGVAKVEIFEGKKDLGAAALNGDGTFTFDDSTTAGGHTGFRAVVTDVAGNSSSSASPVYIQAGEYAPTRTTELSAKSKEKFYFTDAPGQETIYNFQASGQQHNTLEFSRNQFSSLSAVLAAVSDDGVGNSVISLQNGASVTLAGISSTFLKSHPSDFGLHA